MNKVLVALILILFAVCFLMVVQINITEKESKQEIQNLEEDVFWKENYQELQDKLKACEEK